MRLVLSEALFSFTAFLQIIFPKSIHHILFLGTVTIPACQFSFYVSYLLKIIGFSVEKEACLNSY